MIDAMEGWDSDQDDQNKDSTASTAEASAGGVKTEDAGKRKGAASSSDAKVDAS